MDINTKTHFIEIVAADGHYITSYKDTEDIRNYSSFRKAACPLNTDTSIYREITEEEDATYKLARETAFIEDANKESNDNS